MKEKTTERYEAWKGSGGRARRALLSVGVVVVVVTIVLGDSAGAALVVGANPILDNPANDFYIPLQPATSGTLGDPLGGGDYVGLQSDAVSLGWGQITTGGQVDFLLSFDLNGMVASLNGSALVLTFDDIDFKPVVSSAWDFREELEVSYPSKAPLVLDSSNYGKYTTGFVQTNNTTVSYTISMNSLGITQADMDEINQNDRFDLEMEFSSILTKKQYGPGCMTNTPEDIGGKVTFAVVPEPITPAVLGLGSLALTRRRRALKRQSDK